MVPNGIFDTYVLLSWISDFVVIGHRTKPHMPSMRVLYTHHYTNKIHERNIVHVLSPRILCRFRTLPLPFELVSRVDYHPPSYIDSCDLE